MFTVYSILQEINKLPSNKLEEVYEFVHALNARKKKKAGLTKKIMSFAGAFSDMSKTDFKDLKKHSTQVRLGLFDVTNRSK